MAKYKLVNNSTREIWYTNNEKKKTELISKGYHIYEDSKKSKNTNNEKKKGGKEE